ncbi:TOBE domain-containing protein [Sulfurimonas microaerophilic]|uniref:TOBE domain-containing protein n=1 Tax=Sulfurimonas microaerophilic TaxID=3058392 RepID=UPI00271550BC|nr:TOBE domain-containing protein [Sulfurimonas sp. hsl 1-7]
MSDFIATIIDIQSVQSLHLVNLTFQGHNLSMISLELGDEVEIGAEVKLCVKPSNVTLTKQCTEEISISNQLPSQISSIEFGEILTSVKLSFFDYQFETLITTHKAKQMNLQEGEEIIALINESDLSISSVL